MIEKNEKMESTDRFHNDACATWDFNTVLGEAVKEKYKNEYVKVVEVSNRFVNLSEDRVVYNPNSVVGAAATYPVRTNKGLHENLTADKEYIVLKRDYSGYRIQIKDDKDNIIWIDDTLFDVKENISSAGCSDFNLDIRKEAQEKGVPKLGDIVFKDTCALSGIHKKKEVNFVKKEKTHSDFNIHGVVIDTGNPLLLNADKCHKAIERVFKDEIPKKAELDKDLLLNKIKSLVPNVEITWNGESLKVNGATTKIAFYDIYESYTGLLKIASAKVAERTVVRIISSKLNKLF